MLLLLVFAFSAVAGPYTQPGINGYVRPDAPAEHADPADAQAVINPIFGGWATGYVDYNAAGDEVAAPFDEPGNALGPASGQVEAVVSLGEAQAGEEPGRITLTFDRPISNSAGYDFAVFGNALVAQYDTQPGMTVGQLFAELAYVEVSTDGVHFARFSSVSLTEQAVGMYGTIDMTKVHNLAGKHPNGYGICTATGFDLQHLAGHPMVVDGKVDLSNINYIRIVDIPGSGEFYDDASAMTDYASWPSWSNYAQDNPIYDPWPTWGESAGFDLEAVGVLHEYSRSDLNMDGVVDMQDFAFLARSWLSYLGRQRYSARADITGQLSVDVADLAEFASQWLEVQHWSLKEQ